MSHIPQTLAPLMVAAIHEPLALLFVSDPIHKFLFLCYEKLYP